MWQGHRAGHRAYLFSGARPSSDAAASEARGVWIKSSALEQADLAAPEDGTRGRARSLNTHRDGEQRPGNPVKPRANIFKNGLSIYWIAMLEAAR
jgi:hypothetical protein